MDTVSYELAPYGAVSSTLLSASDPVSALAPFEASDSLGASWEMVPFDRISAKCRSYDLRSLPSNLSLGHPCRK
jgi:hypothetical protein